MFNMTLTPRQENIITQRYLQRDRQGNLTETPYEFFQRVASFIASKEENKEVWTQRFMEMLVPNPTSMFMPNTPCLLNAGSTRPQLSACFYFQVQDNIQSIMRTAENAALIFKSGGGVGYDVSLLRPMNSILRTNGGLASGPVSFLNFYDSNCEVWKAGGKRKGAQQATMRVDHPDIMQFITAKSDPERKSLTNFNISVLITDKFMHAVENDLPWLLKHDAWENENGGKAVSIMAREVWDAIVHNAWLTGEPGVVFEDTMQRGNPLPHMGRLGQNPCFEATLYDHDACMLGHVNLNHDKLWKGTEFQEDVFEQLVHDAVRFLDNCLDLNEYPLERLKAVTQAIRRIGLGVMGWAGVLLRCKVAYDTPEALRMAAYIGGLWAKFSDDASHKLAVERGPFPMWELADYGEGKGQGRPMRHITRRSIAPTGTSALIAGVLEQGIEPMFAFFMGRKNNIETTRVEVMHPLAEPFLSAGLDLPVYFRNASDVSPEWHIRMMAEWQKHTDQAISKTVNLPNEATEEDVATAYKLSHELGVKACAVYRDGCRPDQVFQAIKKSDQASELLKTAEKWQEQIDEQARWDQVGEEYCPACKSHNLNRGDGCLTCVDCGWSKCDASFGPTLSRYVTAESMEADKAGDGLWAYSGAK